MTKLEKITETLAKSITQDMREAYAATQDKYLFALDHACHIIDMNLSISFGAPNSDFTDLVVEKFETMLEGETQ